MAYDVHFKTNWAEILDLLPKYSPWDQQKLLTPAGELGVGCVFVPSAAQHAIDFIEVYIKHAKGTKDTPAGAPFLLQPWEKCIIANLFGWKRPDGTRRYRECFIYVAKKNGKTSFSAAILLYMMLQDGETGGEFYSAASSRDQAALLFSHVTGMVRAEPELRGRLTVFGERGGGQNKSVVYEDMASFYRCLSADAGTNDGVNPHLNIIDELHRHPNGELMAVLVKSTAARAQPLTIYTTTADYNRPSPCNDMLKRAKEVRGNKGDPAVLGYAPEFLPVIYETKPSRKNPLYYMEEKFWRKANPNYGITVTPEFFQVESRKANEMPTELNNFLRLHLNIVTDASEIWIPLAKWERCSGLHDKETPQQWRERMLRTLKGRQCFIGVDLSAKVDTTCVMLIFRPPAPPPGVEQTPTPWVIIPFYWVPAEVAKEKELRDKVPYTVWQRQGFCKMTEGDEIDAQAIRRFINTVALEYPVREIAYDEWNATELARQLREEDGFGDKMVVVRQGSISLSDPMKEFEAMVMARRLQHGNNPVMNAQVSNLVVRKDANGNLAPDKKMSTGRIDGPVATFTGMARALAAPPEDPGAGFKVEWF